MALSPLLLKSLFGGVSVAGVGTAASFQIYQAYAAKPVDPVPSPTNETKGDSVKSSENGVPSGPGKPSKPITQTHGTTTPEEIAPATNSVVLVSSLTSLTANPKLTVDNTDHEYKCKVSDTTGATEICRLVKLDFTDNWIDVNGIKKAPSSGTVKLTDLNSEDNHFKLEVNQSLYEKVNLNSQNHIEIISTTTADQKLAKLNVSFKVSGSDIDYVSTNYVLGKALPDSVAYDSSKNYECPIGTSSSTTSASPTHACSIYPFGSTAATLTGAGYHKQTQSDLLNTKPSNPLTKDHYYILKYTNPVSKSDLTTHKTAYINKNEDSTVANVGSFKNLLPVIAQGTTAKKLFILSETPSYSIIVKKSTKLETGKTITHTSTDKNYQCKYNSSEVFNCELVKLDLSDAKTSMNVADIKNADLTSPLSIEQSDTEIKYFKLDVPFAHFETIKTALTTNPVAVQVVEITHESTKMGDLTPIFAIDDNNLVYFHKSSYVVSSATPVTDSATFTDGQKKYCAFADSDSSALADAKECDIKDLDAPITANTNFTSTTDTTSITAESTYLVTFVETAGVTTPTAQDIQDKPLLVLQATSDDDSSKTKVATFAKQHIQPALLVDAANSKKYSFFLSYR